MSIRALLLLVVVGCGSSLGENPGDTTTCSTPGATRACYSGAAGTEGVGPCHGGTQQCVSGTWSACTGEVTPTGEVCGNSIDDNCSGMVDEDVDLDGDGFTTCGGDCCDSTNDGCGSPALVNAGAFEAPGNMLDDDCDGTVDNAVAASCDMGLASNSSNPMDFAKAIDLCQTATANDRKWGVISARFVLPSGMGTPNAVQHSIRPAFGATTVQGGSSFAVLSTGAAAATGQMNPNFAPFQGGGQIGTSSAVPADWLAANGGKLPNAPGCPPPNGGTTGHDPIMLELTIRTPSNAKSFKLSTNFMSSEYPEWVCTAFNDFFVVLLDSAWTGQPANPTDKNLAFYTSPAMTKYPVGVNLAYGNTGLFQVCLNGDIGCADAQASTISTCGSNAELVGTGMDPVNPAPQFTNDPGYCGTNNQVGGGTGWLVTSGNVNGSEVITLRIAIWDTSDGYYDSISIIDNFQWSVDSAMPGTVIL